ncbi:MAG: O-phosphoserine--tRNA ligase [Methanoregulaceae archaeon]
MRFNVEEWRDRSRSDFEGAWYAGPEVLTPPGSAGRYPRLAYPRAARHPVFETIHRLREAYLSIGFTEYAVPIIVEEAEVYRQFGPEAMAVLDRVFYLGGLPRPNVGIARERLDRINAILGKEMDTATEEGLRETLHGYKKGTVDGDELAHVLAEVLGTDDGVVVRVLDEVFPEFRALSPESSRSTLRSHMTSGWFMTLGAVWDRSPLPLRLFSVDRCFRREQEEGPTRLMTYHSASCVVAGEDVTNEEGKAVATALLSAFGFTDFRFQPDEKRSKYYMPDSQTEVYARHPVHGWVEVATFGLYSPSALAEYGIGVPVMNLGLGVERLAMVLGQADDVRAMVFPQFFPQPLSDAVLAGAVGLREEPATVEGRRMAAAIATVAAKHADAQGPVSFEAWAGEVAGTRVRVFVEEPESTSRLLGPACLNEVFVRDGSVLGVPDTEKFRDVREHGVPTGIRVLDAVAALGAARIEEASRCGEATTVQVKMAKLPSDINLRVAEHAMRSITDTKKKVDVRGPVFMTVRSEVVETSII